MKNSQPDLSEAAHESDHSTSPIRPKRSKLKTGLLIAASVVLVGAGTAFAVLVHSHGLKGAINKVSSPITSSNLSAAEKAGQQLAGGNCSGKGVGQLTHSAMDPKDFGFIIPYGLMVGGHVTPIDHQYYAPTDYNSARDAYPVYAMGDAHLTQIQHRVQPVTAASQGRITDEYRLVFSQTCTFLYYYDLVTSLTPDIKAQFDKGAGGTNNAGVDITVKSGQLIGHIGGQTLDFAVWNTEKTLPGFVNPATYSGEAWKIYTADPLDYYSADLKTLMLSKYPRTTAPLSGKIDWDVDGKLIGNWFAQGSGGYSGDQHGTNGYWSTHLSFAPDLYDESHFIISMGDFGGQAQQFYAKGNTPDPATVDASSGLVKYELVKGSYFDAAGVQWNQMGFDKNLTVREQTNSGTIGTVLVQVNADKTLKFESFPGKTPAQVTAFTSAAKTYTR